MAITLPYQKQGHCIACGDEHKREPRAWRCWSCDQVVDAARSSAIRAIKKAIGSGELPPAKACACVDCGGKAFDYDHRDYSKPLDVQPVCRSCNQRRGPALTTPRPVAAPALARTTSTS